MFLSFVWRDFREGAVVLCFSVRKFLMLFVEVSVWTNFYSKCSPPSSWELLAVYTGLLVLASVCTLPLFPIELSPTLIPSLRTRIWNNIDQFLMNFYQMLFNSFRFRVCLKISGWIWKDFPWIFRNFVSSYDFRLFEAP